MSPELWWNHSKQDIQEQKLQSVVNGEKNNQYSFK